MMGYRRLGLWSGSVAGLSVRLVDKCADERRASVVALCLGNVADDRATRPVGERGHVRIDDHTPGGERQPHHQQCEDRRSDASKGLRENRYIHL